MDSLKSIEAIATQLEARGMICDIDHSRYHPLKILSRDRQPLAGIRMEQGEWIYCLAFDAHLEASGVDKGELERMLQKILHSSPV